MKTEDLPQTSEEKKPAVQKEQPKENTPVEMKKEEVKPARIIPRKAFEEVNQKVKDTLIEDADNRIIHQLLNLGRRKKDPEGVVRVVADSLPHILPGVILKKREELIPVILVVIGQHPEASVRYTLTKMLFNLIKKPNQYERKIIVEAFMTLANITSEHTTETELLPQW